MMRLASECSNGSESGWTMYFDHFSFSANPCQRGGGFGGAVGTFGEDYKEEEAKEDEEEDLSMVSDASSGPPHFHEDEYCNDNGCFYSASSAAALVKKSGKRQRVEEHPQPHPSFLDDTASSPIVSCSKNNFNVTKKHASMESVLNFSRELSRTQSKGKSSLQKHLGFLKPALPRKPSSITPDICREESGNEIVISSISSSTAAVLKKR